MEENDIEIDGVENINKREKALRDEIKRLERSQKTSSHKFA